MMRASGLILATALIAGTALADSGLYHEPTSSTIIVLETDDVNDAIRLLREQAYIEKRAREKAAFAERRCSFYGVGCSRKKND